MFLEYRYVVESMPSSLLCMLFRSSSVSGLLPGRRQRSHTGRSSAWGTYWNDRTSGLGSSRSVGVTARISTSFFSQVAFVRHHQGDESPQTARQRQRFQVRWPRR